MFYKLNYYLLLAANALMSLLFIIFKIDSGMLYYIFSLILFFIILNKRRNNIIFLIRSFFLGVPAYLAYTSLLIDPNTIFSYHLISSQTYEIVLLMFLLTNIALFSSELGILMGSNVQRVKKIKGYKIESKKLFYSIGIILFLLSLLYLKSRHGIGSYGLQKSESIGIGNLNSIINILFFIMILLYYKQKNFLKKNTKYMLRVLIFMFVFIYLYIEFLHGVRMPALNAFVGIYILYKVYNNGSLRIELKHLIPISILYMLMQFIGIIRSGFDRISSNAILDQIFRLKSEIIFDQGTINNIAATFSGIIMLLNKNIVEFKYGSTYFDYLLRTPPKFIYPDRPEDLSWLFVNHGFTSGGGFFELAEAYLNFGVVGLLIIPFSISFIIAYSYKVFINNKYSLKSAILLFSILAVYLRGLMYQTFALYKSVFTGAILFFILYSVYIVIKNRHKI